MNLKMISSLACTAALQADAGASPKPCPTEAHETYAAPASEPRQVYPWAQAVQSNHSPKPVAVQVNPTYTALTAPQAVESPKMVATIDESPCDLPEPSDVIEVVTPSDLQNVDSILEEPQCEESHAVKVYDGSIYCVEEEVAVEDICGGVDDVMTGSVCPMVGTQAVSNCDDRKESWDPNSLKCFLPANPKCQKVGRSYRCVLGGTVEKNLPSSSSSASTINGLESVVSLAAMVLGFAILRL